MVVVLLTLQGIYVGVISSKIVGEIGVGVEDVDRPRGDLLARRLGGVDLLLLLCLLLLLIGLLLGLLGRLLLGFFLFFIGFFGFCLVGFFRRCLLLRGGFPSARFLDCRLLLSGQVDARVDKECHDSGDNAGGDGDCDDRACRERAPLGRRGSLVDGRFVGALADGGAYLCGVSHHHRLIRAVRDRCLVRVACAGAIHDRRLVGGVFIAAIHNRSRVGTVRIRGGPNRRPALRAEPGTVGVFVSAFGAKHGGSSHVAQTLTSHNLTSQKWQ